MQPYLKLLSSRRVDYLYFAEKNPGNYKLRFFSQFLLKTWPPYERGLGLVSTRKFSL